MRSYVNPHPLIAILEVFSHIIYNFASLILHLNVAIASNGKWDLRVKIVLRKSNELEMRNNRKRLHNYNELKFGELVKSNTSCDLWSSKI